MSEDKLPVRIDVSAKAEVSGRVPDETMGRIGNALADALSPLTEGLGLVGDAIRAHRANQVIKRVISARRLIEQAGLQVHGAPLKFIAPWAEAVSLEDDASDLNSMWEKLLANASVAYEQRYNSYVDILRNMSGDEARFLNRLCRDGDLTVYYDIKRDWIEHIVGDTETVLANLVIKWRETGNTPGGVVAWADAINTEAVFEHDWRNARLVTLFQYPQAQRKLDGSVTIHNGIYHYRPGTTENIFIHRNLVRQGLAYEATIQAKVTFLDDEYVVPVWFLQATEVAIDLVRTCSRFPKTP